MILRRLDTKGSLGVRGGNVHEQVASILFADDFELRQQNEERLANAEGRHAIGFIRACLLCMRCPFDRQSIAARHSRPLIHISEASYFRV